MTAKPNGKSQVRRVNQDSRDNPVSVSPVMILATSSTQKNCAANRHAVGRRRCKRPLTAVICNLLNKRFPFYLAPHDSVHANLDLSAPSESGPMSAGCARMPESRGTVAGQRSSPAAREPGPGHATQCLSLPHSSSPVSRAIMLPHGLLLSCVRRSTVDRRAKARITWFSRPELSFIPVAHPVQVGVHPDDRKEERISPNAGRQPGLSRPQVVTVNQA